MQNPLTTVRLAAGRAVAKFFNLSVYQEQPRTVRRYGHTVAGPLVNEDTAMTFSAVWRAVTAITVLGALPYHIYQREGQKRTPRFDHPVDWLISMQPNPEMNAIDFWPLCLQRVLLWGNFYAEIDRNMRNEPAALWPIEPWRVQPRRNESGDLAYYVSNGTTAQTEIALADMYHIKGLGDGLVGQSVVALARESIALGLSMEQFGASFFGNGAHVGTVIEAPVGMELEKAAADALVEEFDFRNRVQGPHRTLFLDKGMKVTSASVPPEDAQFLESRKFSVTEIARWFGVPPHLMYDLERSTNNNIEHQGIEFVTYTLLNWARRIEKQTDIKLFGRQQRGIFYSKINLDGLQRGDMKTRFEAYAFGKDRGWLSADDIREKEDMNPLKKGGDEYLVQVNMTPVDLLREMVQANIDKANAPPPQQAGGGNSAGGNPETSPTDASKRLRQIQTGT